MNPFLHSTVAQPARLVDQGRSPIAVPPSWDRRRRRVKARRMARALSAVGFAALAWSGGVLALDLNSATVTQLQGIRGIGPKTAQIILQERDRGGRYASFTDLSVRVRGIGPRRAEALRAAGLSIEGDVAGVSVGAPKDGPQKAATRAQPPRR